MWQLSGYLDFMKLQLRREKDTSELFKTAGSVMEVGAKILSVQIDDIHTQTLKLAARLTKVLPSGETDSDDENEDMETDSHEKDKKTNKRKHIKKNRNLNNRLIADNDDCLNAQIQPHPLVRTTNTNENLDKTLLTKPQKNCELLNAVQTKQILWSYVENVKIDEGELNQRALRLPKRLKKLQICPANKKFDIDNFDVNKDYNLPDITTDFDDVS